MDELVAAQPAPSKPLDGQTLDGMHAGARRADGSGDEDAMDELVMPPDLPIEAIAEEVKESWRLKEVHVERLLQQAVARSERPWLILLTTLSALSAALLAFVLLKLTSVLH